MRISAWSSDVCSSDLEALAQAVKTLGHGLAGVAGERLGAEIDLDAGDHAGPGDLLHERRAVGGLLADGLVVEDDAGDVLAGIGRGEQHVAVVAPVLLGRGDLDAVEALLDGGGAFVRGQEDRQSTRLNSSHKCAYRMPSSA